jgi:hypothetical protein
MPGSDPARCDRLAIKVYSTWFIRGARYQGVLSLKRLGELSDLPQDFTA